MKNYNIPINTLETILQIYNIPCINKPLFSGRQLTFPWCKGDVICHEFSIGSQKNKVETFRFPWDNDDVTSLDILSVAILIIEYYKIKKGE